MHAVPPDDRSAKDLPAGGLHPGFNGLAAPAFLGRKVNERLGKRPISAPYAAHSQDLIDFSAIGGI
jgi:hypothetical protein